MELLSVEEYLQKVLNPMAIEYKKEGTEKARLFKRYIKLKK